jgi:hypothetical protein
MHQKAIGKWMDFWDALVQLRIAVGGRRCAPRLQGPVPVNLLPGPFACSKEINLSPTMVKWLMHVFVQLRIAGTNALIAEGVFVRTAQQFGGIVMPPLFLGPDRYPSVVLTGIW